MAEGVNQGGAKSPTSALPGARQRGQNLGRGSIPQDVTREVDRLVPVACAPPGAVVSEKLRGANGELQEARELGFREMTADMLGLRLEELLPERLREGHVRSRADYMADFSPRSMGRDRDVVGRRTRFTHTLCGPCMAQHHPAEGEG